MPWLKTVGCDCPECGPDPCTAGCACTFETGSIEVSDTSRTDYYDVTGQFIIDKTLYYDYTISAETQYDRMQIFADATELYDSGCVTAGSSGSVTVPAGTTEISVVVTLMCSGTIDPSLLFTLYSLTCQDA